MLELTSKEYSKIISQKSQTSEDIRDEVNEAYLACMLNAGKIFMDTYKTVKDAYYQKLDGMSFEALDLLFQTCTKSLMGGNANDGENICN